MINVNEPIEIDLDKIRKLILLAEKREKGGYPPGYLVRELIKILNGKRSIVDQMDMACFTRCKEKQGEEM